MAALLVILSVFIVMIEGSDVSDDCLSIESCTARTKFEDPRAVALRNLNNYVKKNLPYCYGQENCSVINPLNMDAVYTMYDHLRLDNLTKIHYQIKHGIYLLPSTFIEQQLNAIAAVPIYIGDLVLVTVEQDGLVVKTWKSTITAFIPYGLNHQVYGMIQFHHNVEHIDIWEYSHKNDEQEVKAVPCNVYLINRDIARKYLYV